MRDTRLPARGASTVPADMPYRVAEDPHWLTAGSTRHTAHPGDADHGGRGHHAGPTVPVNLSVLDLAEQHRGALREFAARHGHQQQVPEERHAVARLAATLATTSDQASEEYEALQLASALLSALTIGDGDAMLARMACPGCRCWSLIAVAAPGGTWAATCRNLNCAPHLGTRSVWTLPEVARHNTGAPLVQHRALPGGEHTAADYGAVADRLREHPGQWEPVRTCTTPGAAKQTAHKIRNGLRAPFRPAGSFEAATRREADQQYTVRARYVGQAAAGHHVA